MTVFFLTPSAVDAPGQVNFTQGKGRYFNATSARDRSSKTKNYAIATFYALELSFRLRRTIPPKYRTPQLRGLRPARIENFAVALLDRQDNRKKGKIETLSPQTLSVFNSPPPWGGLGGGFLRLPCLTVLTMTN